jgi:YcxB-like protein
MTTAQSDSMEVRFRTSRKDYQSLWSAIWIGRNKHNPYAWGFRVIACVMLICLWIGFALAVQSDWSVLEEFEPKAYGALVWFIGATALYVLISFTQMRLVARTHLWDRGLLLQEHFVRIGADGIESGSERAYGKYSWEAVLEVFTHRQLLLFRLDGAMFIYVPRSAFESDEKFQAFERFATEYWRGAETDAKRVF